MIFLICKCQDLEIPCEFYAAMRGIIKTTIENEKVQSSRVYLILYLKVESIEPKQARARGEKNPHSPISLCSFQKKIPFVRKSPRYETYVPSPSLVRLPHFAATSTGSRNRDSRARST